MSILSKDTIKLWFTHYLYLNDRSEGGELQKIFVFAVKQLTQECEISDELATELLKMTFEDRDLFASTIETEDLPLTRITEEEDNTFLCCFSHDGDSLSMWRYYSKEQTGICLEFLTHSIKEEWNIRGMDSEESYIGKFTLDSVVYNNEKKVDLVKAIILEAKDLMGDNIGIAKAVKTRLVQSCYRFTFKNTCFYEEKEIRGILKVPVDSSKHQKNSFDIKYRAQNGILIPYIERNLSIRSLKSIKVSPIADELAYESIKRYVRDCIGEGVEVTKSELPVRF